MSETNVLTDRFEDEVGLLYDGPPFPQDGPEVPGFVRMPADLGQGACGCGSRSSSAATFREMQTDPDPEDPLADSPEPVSVEAIVRRAFEEASRSNPQEAANLGWTADDLPGWLGVHLGYAPALPWPLPDAWDRATMLLRVPPRYLTERSHRLPGDRPFVLGAAILAEAIRRLLGREGLGAAAVHNEVWRAAEAAEDEARPRVV